MSIFFTTLHKAVLALALACSSAAALAGPTYHVTVNTAGLTGTGYLDFSVVGTAGAPGAVASVSNLAGDFGMEAERVGAVVGAIPGGFSLSNAAGDNYLTQAVNFGGLFGFDISFAGDYESVEGIDGATFAVGLYDASFSQYSLAATFAAQPRNGLTDSSLSATAHLPAVSIEEVEQVPEPSDLALALAALAAAGVVYRRRR